jgi:hypothetical protein
MTLRWLSLSVGAAMVVFMSWGLARAWWAGRTRALSPITG